MMLKAGSATWPATDGKPPAQGLVICIAMAGLAILALVSGLIADGVMPGVRMAGLAATGFAAGLALYHTSFGFTSAWRRFLAERRSVGIRAQLAMIGVTILVSFPLLGMGSLAGQPVTGFVNPVGLALIIGAFLFGIGMQLGGGCGSGTLYTAGGGSTRMAVTLAAFIFGSLIATANPAGWMSWPAIDGVSIITLLGWGPALAAALGALALAWLLLGRMEGRRHGETQALLQAGAIDWLRGPWPLIAGALALAAVAILTFALAGRPWGITSAFALWGAKLAAAGGIDVAGWRYWQGDLALQASIFTDVTSVMDFGLMLGAFAAAGLAGRYAPQRRLPMRSLLAALIGGLIMGIGARLATGCNIGAFFSGIASGSLHGVVWLAFAIPGNWLGMKLRPLFRLD